MLALNNIDFKSSIALKTGEALENIAWQAKKCTIAWLKAHIGIEGYEVANEAARQGAENKNKRLQIINTPIPAEHVKSIIDEATRKEWKRKWNNALHYKHTFLIVVQIKTESSVYLIFLGHT